MTKKRFILGMSLFLIGAILSGLYWSGDHDSIFLFILGIACMVPLPGYGAYMWGGMWYYMIFKKRRK